MNMERLKRACPCCGNKRLRVCRHNPKVEECGKCGWGDYVVMVPSTTIEKLYEAQRKAWFECGSEVYARFHDIAKNMQVSTDELTYIVSDLIVRGEIRISAHRQGLRSDGAGYRNDNEYQYVQIDFLN
jgi:hypothetical protein